MQDFISTEYNEKLVQLDLAQAQFTVSIGVLAPEPSVPVEQMNQENEDSLAPAGGYGGN